MTVSDQRGCRTKQLVYSPFDAQFPAKDGYQLK